VQIHWRDMDEIDADRREAIERRLGGLAEGHSDLIDLWITGSRTRHHRHGAQEVRLRCQARGREIVAARTRPDVGQALDEVIDAFEREVRKLRDRRGDQRALRAAEPAQLGIVDRVFADEGYGFILTDAGDRVYFHRNAVHGGLSFERLTEGERVGLNLEAGERGLQATVVRPAPPDAIAP
jgi:cold shock CspA family protein/ribosome-associated translation inhibitor RaiA